MKFSEDAMKAWDAVPVFVKINTLNEAWCNCCLEEAPMALEEGHLKGQKLLLEGHCEHCGNEIETSIIEQPRLAYC